MGKLKVKKMKIGGVIFIFSLLLTMAFSASIAWISFSFNNKQVTKEALYPISSTEYLQLAEADGTLKIDSEKLVGESDYQSKYLQSIFSKLLPVSFFFLVFLCFMSFCLYLIIKKMQSQHTLRIVNELKDAMNEAVICDEPELLLAYSQLREQFDNSLKDYKRLNSYLSHEQKNALSIIRTNMELSQNKEYLKSIDYISSSIDDVLTLSENSDITALTAVDVSLVCAEVCDSYRKISDKITFDFNEAHSTEIFAKSRWIYRAVANLLDNAIKYGENNPISLCVKAIKGSVVVCVHDNGIGISNEKQEAIFSNHYRINELNKDGYGIGLSLVSHVCDLCGGFVMVDSVLGEGSTFYLSFPQKQF